MNMTQIDGLRLEVLPNGAHFSYHKTTVERAKADATIPTKCTSFLTIYETGLAELDKVFKLSQKNLLTDEIAASDAVRDKAYRAYYACVKALVDFPDEEMAAAAKILFQHLKDYNINLQGQMDKQTGELLNLTADLTEKYAEQVATLNLTKVAEKLKEANDQTAALPLLVDAPSLAGIELSELCARTLSRAAGTELDLAAAESLVAERGVTLFVDGLDECRGADARAAMLGALDALATSPVVRAVVATSRPSEEIAPAGFTTLRLAPFSRQEQIAFLDRNAGVQGIGWSGESLLDALPADLRELAERPLFLALIVTAVAYRGDLPETTDELFDDYLNVLLGGYATEEALMVERVLCELAFWCVRESCVTVPLKKIGEVCERMTGDMEATELLRRSVLESGVLAPAHGGASFAHLTLMDHLARNYAASIYNFEPSHSMVQYFLRNPKKIEWMVSSGCVMPTDRVAELGAGIGSVARHIPQAKSLTLVELDERLATILRNDFSERQDVTVHQGDAIAWLAGHDVDVIFSNLPFFLTDELLDVLAEKEFRVAVVAMPPDHSHDDWEDRLRFTYVETNEGGDYFPPQPVASEVMKVTPRRR